MFIPIEGEDCILLNGAIAFVNAEGRTTVYYSDGSTRETGFRPVTLKARYLQIMKQGRKASYEKASKGGTGNEQ